MKRLAALLLIVTAIVVACVDGSGLGAGQSPPAAVDAGSNPIDATTPDTTAPASNDGGTDATLVDAGPPWTLYGYFEQSGNWAAPLPVDQYFGTTANAPPPRGISSISLASSIDRLFVFTTDGQLYIRAGATWLAPKPANVVFTSLGSAVPRAGYALPLRDGGSASISYTAAAPPLAYLFTYANDMAVPIGTPVALTDAEGGAPQASRAIDWDFELYDVAKTDGSWAVLYMGFGDDIYRFDASFVWTHWTSATFPYFAGHAGAPPPNRIRAAFYDSNLRVLYMLCEPG